MRLGTLYRYELLKNRGLFSNIKSESRILDIGGFDGYTLSKLSSKDKTLIDINVNKKFKGINYIKQDFFKQDFPNNYFNYIFAFDVLEHIPKNKEEEFFRKIEQLLKKNGEVYITVPSKNIKIFPNFLTGWVSKRWGHYKCRGYSKEELENFVKGTKLNYTIKETGAKNFLRFYLFLKIIEGIITKRIIYKIIKKIAKKDSIIAKGNEGYHLIEMKK